jgi:glycosyltransferase involved in cell wall biosynthesis
MSCSISIIVPIYNAEKYLLNCLQSLALQQLNDIEFILIDDGSTDCSGIVCRDYIKTDDRFRYYYKENGGVSSARNCGILLARGHFIGFVDADDTIHPEMFLRLMMQMQSADMVVCGYQVNNKFFSNGQQSNDNIDIWNAEEAVKQFITNPKVQGFVCNKLFRADLIKENNILFNPNLHICEDLDYCIRYAILCRQINFSRAPLYNYVINSDGAMSKAFNARQLTLIDAFDNMKKLPNLTASSIKLLMHRQVIMLLSLLRKMLKNDGGSHLDYDLIVHTINLQSQGFIFSPGISIKHRLAFMLFKLNPKLLRLT